MECRIFFNFYFSFRYFLCNFPFDLYFSLFFFKLIFYYFFNVSIPKQTSCNYCTACFERLDMYTIWFLKLLVRKKELENGQCQLVYKHIRNMIEISWSWERSEISSCSWQLGGLGGRPSGEFLCPLRWSEWGLCLSYRTSCRRWCPLNAQKHPGEKNIFIYWEKY